MCHNSQPIPSATTGGESYRAGQLCSKCVQSCAIQSTDKNIAQQTHLYTTNQILDSVKVATHQRQANTYDSYLYGKNAMENTSLKHHHLEL